MNCVQTQSDTFKTPSSSGTHKSDDDDERASMNHYNKGNTTHYPLYRRFTSHRERARGSLKCARSRSTPHSKINRNANYHAPVADAVAAATRLISPGGYIQFFFLLILIRREPQKHLGTIIIIYLSPLEVSASARVVVILLLLIYSKAKRNYNFLMMVNTRKSSCLYSFILLLSVTYIYVEFAYSINSFSRVCPLCAAYIYSSTTRGSMVWN